MTGQSTLLWLGAAGAAGVGLYVLEKRSNESKSAKPAASPAPPAFGSASTRGKRPRLRAVSGKFDRVFAEHARGLPLPYLRALAKRESNMNPRETDGPAWGLMQVIEVVRRDHNKDHGTSYTRRDLLTPSINVEIATTLLRRIIRSFQRNHSDVPNMRADWTNPRFVELLTFAWNSGWSERGGIGRVARYLKKRGRANEITVELIHAHARDAGAIRFLSETGRMRWSKSVARYYMSEQLRELDNVA